MKIKAFLLALLSLVLVCLYPCLFQFAGNAPESELVDAALFFGIFFGLGVVVLAAAYLLLRQWGAAGLLADVAMLMIINGGLLTGALSAWGIRARYPLAAMLVLLILLLVLLKRKGWRCQVPCVLLALVFGVLSLVSLGMGAPELLRELRQNASRAPARSTEALRRQGGPNVYYYIYDEYGGPENLRYFYDYDSGGFYQELQQRGFQCSSDSYNTESCATVQLIPDLYDLSYEATPYFQSGDGKEPRLYGLFRDMGYQVNLINHYDFLDTDGTTVLTQNQHSDSIAVYLYQNSLLKVAYPLFEKLPQLQQLKETVAMALDALDCMEDAWKYTAGKPTLTLGYVSLPHSYFLFDQAGNVQPQSEWRNWQDPEYYLGQLEYTNRRILGAVDSILAHDPGAVIILQSDHGARLGYHLKELYDAPYDAETETIYQQNILNCVYWGGEELDISGLSGVNTLRTILNATYGTEYELLPQPTGFVSYFE